MAYNFTAIEKKWQKYWLDNKTFAALDPAAAGSMPKSYVLDMFPYPSGSGLHVGHPEGYTATDIVSRYRRMQGFNVLHPMGWDAFGLPAEQHAIREANKGNKVHPSETTRQAINNFRRQIRMLGLSYDWDREVDTTDPKYYRWTQWIFLQLFNSYFDPINGKAKPISHLMQELVNENYVIGPDNSIHVNAASEGMEAVAGEVRIERLWREMSADERREVIDAQRLAYMDEIPVNWCPALGTVLANEEVIDGKSEVGGFPVERRPMRQWMLRITAYADRLLNDLDLLTWPESLKEMQRNWIGRSIGAEVDFEVAAVDGAAPLPAGEEVPGDEDMTITVFTTRPDTLYGATYMVLAPEHPLVERITTADKRAEVDAYRQAVAGKSERDRMAETKTKTGAFTGAYAINPVNEARIPIYIADYVLMGYGTGAIMAVPAHDQRDYEFATQFGLPIKVVVEPLPGREAPKDAAFPDEGIAINSAVINHLPTADAKQRMIEWLEEQGVGTGAVKFKLRDWLFSRQRYWGEPFPILLDEQGNAYALPEEELPVELPAMEDFKPTGTPEPPLSKARDWVHYEVKATDDDDAPASATPASERVATAFGEIAVTPLFRETNTMPQWAGSCWYYLRYIDPRNDQRFVDPAKERYWMPVDLYVGGAEHAVLHLLYARFWHKVLFDLGHVCTPEPFARLVNQGLILGEMEYHSFQDQAGQVISAADVRDVDEEATPDGVKLIALHRQGGQKLLGKRLAEEEVERTKDGFVLKSNPSVRVDARSFKMSKSRGNVVNPDEIVRDYGADCFRLYEMYLGPLEAQKPWNTRDIVGMARFLSSVWRNLIGDVDEGAVTAEPPAKNGRVADAALPDALDRMMHRTIKKVGEDIEAMRFNTAIAELIKLNNEVTGLPSVPRPLAENLTLMLAPFAPHIAEEIWERLGHHKSLARRPWPSYDPAKLVESTMELPVQVNGKLRDKIQVPVDADQDAIFAAAEKAPGVATWLAGKTVRKRIYVEKKLVSFVV